MTATGVLTPAGFINERQGLIQGVAIPVSIASPGTDFIHANTRGKVGMKYRPSSAGDNGGAATFAGTGNWVTRRYTFQPMFGLFLQDKLIPVKFMASQLAVEFTLETAAGCLFVPFVGGGASPTYAVNNMNLVPEILQFDASYDAIFLKGLREGGV